MSCREPRHVPTNRWDNTASSGKVPAIAAKPSAKKTRAARIGLTRIVPSYSAFKGGIIRSNPHVFHAAAGKNAEHAAQFGNEADVAQADKMGNGGQGGEWRVLASP